METIKKFERKELYWDIGLSILLGISLYLDFVRNLSPIALLPLLFFTIRIVIVHGKFFGSCDTIEKIQTMKDYIKKDTEKKFAWIIVSIIFFVASMIWLSFSPKQPLVYLLMIFAFFSFAKAIHKLLFWIMSRQAKPINDND